MKQHVGVAEKEDYNVHECGHGESGYHATPMDAADGQSEHAVDYTGEAYGREWLCAAECGYDGGGECYGQQAAYAEFPHHGKECAV